MDVFYRDCLRFGCLQEFKHFDLYLRGREELQVTIHHDSTGGPSPAHARASFGLSSQQLPPASPATHELSKDDPKVTVFLIGAYARYNWPYVWLRSNLAKFGQSKEDKDLPLDLRTTSGWKLHGYRVWDIVEELVTMNTLPGPANPFEVDLEAFASMDAMQRTLRAGAMAHFLRELMLSERELKYIELVQKDLVRMLEIHFESVAEYVPADR